MSFFYGKKCQNAKYSMQNAFFLIFLAKKFGHVKKK